MLITLIWMYLEFLRLFARIAVAETGKGAYKPCSFAKRRGIGGFCGFFKILILFNGKSLLNWHTLSKEGVLKSSAPTPKKGSPQRKARQGS